MLLLLSVLLCFRIHSCCAFTAEANCSRTTTRAFASSLWEGGSLPHAGGSRCEPSADWKRTTRPGFTLAAAPLSVRLRKLCSASPKLTCSSTTSRSARRSGAHSGPGTSASTESTARRRSHGAYAVDGGGAGEEGGGGGGGGGGGTTAAAGFVGALLTPIDEKPLTRLEVGEVLSSSHVYAGGEERVSGLFG